MLILRKPEFNFQHVGLETTSGHQPRSIKSVSERWREVGQTILILESHTWSNGHYRSLPSRRNGQDDKK